MTRGIEQAWVATLVFVPNLLLALVIGVVGYFVAKFVGTGVQRLLKRTGFDRMVERGGLKQAMERSGYDVSDIVGKVSFWVVFLFVLQMAFGVFGPNPISDLLTRMIAFLPNVFVATLIVVISAALATGVKEIVQASLGGLSYGKTIAYAAAIAILTVGIFAALNQLLIAPAIVNGLFYAILAVIAGSAIVAIGGGGIRPMREVWYKAMHNLEQQSPQIATTLDGAPERVQHRAQEVTAEMEHARREEEAPMAYASPYAAHMEDETHQPF